jgi:hypothetical protein
MGMGRLRTMSDDGVSFEVESDGQFFITIADGAHIYESKDDAISEIGDILDDDDDAFIAETSIENGGEDGDGVSISLDQLKWQKIIPQMTD